MVIFFLWNRFLISNPTECAFKLQSEVLNFLPQQINGACYRQPKCEGPICRSIISMCNHMERRDSIPDHLNTNTGHILRSPLRDIVVGKIRGEWKKIQGGRKKYFSNVLRSLAKLLRSLAKLLRSLEKLCVLFAKLWRSPRKDICVPSQNLKKK